MEYVMQARPHVGQQCLPLLLSIIWTQASLILIITGLLANFLALTAGPPVAANGFYFHYLLPFNIKCWGAFFSGQTSLEYGFYPYYHICNHLGRLLCC